ncbi:AAA family ATPase [Salinibacterium sp. ZJ454]|uniref:AAA family ATPase n=1 Tax=Salinibacterium sp. ZJ454 TaxID=2708339 RepID=UPI00141DFEEC|nr:AAA family ATPase [Salinibacterium sp. ZJ454]
MRLTRVDVRFFRSFNFDYELKARESSQPAPWEEDSPWFPFVRVPLDSEITAIVGANEAGKTQLLTAIEAALTGSPIDRADFCRYSERYSVKTNEIRLPEFGGTFALDAGEPAPEGVTSLGSAREFTLYRPGDRAPFLVIGNERVEIPEIELQLLESALPKIHQLKTGLAIPDSVSISELAGEPAPFLRDRRHRASIFGALLGLTSPTEESVGKAVFPALSAGKEVATLEAEKNRRAEFELARQLLVDAAGIDPRTFSELRGAIESGKEGQVEAIVGAINSAIKENVNIQRWWTQDRNFDLLVEAREHELAFTIRDRTTSKYSFGERSQGLRFFLSYFVQLTAHKSNTVKPDILLLDEPDAFLSSAGQQDFLRVLHEYAIPEDGGPQSQVVYVTHSPFLIDKNAPQRIRVLDKGSEDEGTRVVRDAANNRYEPLRSSLGAHVAETAFIGGKNLFVEGLVDQILIAGISAHIATREHSTASVLNLNDVTVVASGGADSIPYMVYLARGRDTVKPPCVALLDGDESGRDAERVLKRGEARKKRILRDEYIVRLDTWAANSGLEFDEHVVVNEIEDLIPVAIAHRAALNFLARFVDLDDMETASFSVDGIRAALARNGGRMWDAIDESYRRSFPEEHIEKAGLAREIVSLLSIDETTDGADEIRARFRSLLGNLAERLEDALEEEERARADDRLKRAVKNFSRNHTQGMRKHDARKLLREIEVALEHVDFDNQIRPKVQSIVRDYELADLSQPNVPRFATFREEIRKFSTVERLSYQDDARKDPAASVVHAPSALHLVGAEVLAAGDVSVDGNNQGREGIVPKESAQAV